MIGVTVISNDDRLRPIGLELAEQLRAVTDIHNADDLSRWIYMTLRNPRIKVETTDTHALDVYYRDGLMTEREHLLSVSAR